MAEYKMPSRDIFHRPGAEGSCEGVDKQAEAHSSSLPSPSHEHVHKPGAEGSSGLAQNDQGYRQGNRDGAQAAPGYVGPGGPEVMKTRVAPANGSDPTPAMPGA